MYLRKKGMKRSILLGNGIQAAVQRGNTAKMTPDKDEQARKTFSKGSQQGRGTDPDSDIAKGGRAVKLWNELLKTTGEY